MQLRKHDCAWGETDPGANHFVRNPKRDVVFTRDDGVVSPSYFPVISGLDANPQRSRSRPSLFSAPTNPAGLGVPGDGQSQVREIVSRLPPPSAFRPDHGVFSRAFFLAATHRLRSSPSRLSSYPPLNQFDGTISRRSSLLVDHFGTSVFIHHVQFTK